MKKAQQASTDLALKNEDALSKQSSSGPLTLQVIDMSAGDIPDLDEAQALPFDMMSEYWEPDTIGETKNVYFDRIEPALFPDFNDPSITVEVDCAHFYEKTKGVIKPWRNASKRLVSLLEALKLAPGSILCLTYLGKKKNKKNSNESARWSVKPLILKLKNPAT